MSVSLLLLIRCLKNNSIKSAINLDTCTYVSYPVLRFAQILACCFTGGSTSWSGFG